MHADYIANPLYDNNPFIEALPPMLSGKDLIRALAVIPPYSDSDRDRSTGERLQLLSSLYEFYQPLSMTVDLYCEIHTAMQHCYGQYSVQSEAATFQNGYSLMHGNALAASIGGGNSFYRCRRIRTWQVHRIAARVIVISAGHRTYRVSWAKVLLPPNPVLGCADPARCVH
mgnify:CR=1 FL=1